jgi:hypothetical protein
MSAFPDFKTATLELRPEKAAVISFDMAEQLVSLTPQPLMGGHGYDHDAIGTNDAARLHQSEARVNLMFDHV